MALSRVRVTLRRSRRRPGSVVSQSWRWQYAVNEVSADRCLFQLFAARSSQRAIVYS